MAKLDEPASAATPDEEEEEVPQAAVPPELVANSVGEVDNFFRQIGHLVKFCLIGKG